MRGFIHIFIYGYVTLCCLSCRLAEVVLSAAEGAAAPAGARVSGQPTGRDHQRHRRQGERVSMCARPVGCKRTFILSYSLFASN